MCHIRSCDVATLDPGWNFRGGWGDESPSQVRGQRGSPHSSSVSHHGRSSTLRWSCLCCTAQPDKGICLQGIWILFSLISSKFPFSCPSLVCIQGFVQIFGPLAVSLVISKSRIQIKEERCLSRFLWWWFRRGSAAAEAGHSPVGQENMV